MTWLATMSALVIVLLLLQLLSRKKLADFGFVFIFVVLSEQEHS